MLNTGRPGVARLASFFAAPFVALRIPPNALSVLGGLLMFIPAALAAQGDYLVAGLSLLFVAGFDAIDGAVARATNRVTAFGGLLDSVVDRVADAAILFGIGLSPLAGAYGRWWWIIIGCGVVGQYLTSYVRARAHQDIHPPADTWRQLFERPERILFLAAILVAQGLLDRSRLETEVVFFGLVIDATLTLFTTMVRMWRVRRLLEQTHK